MQQLRRKGSAVRLLDIAAGHGRYVLEAVEKRPYAPSRCCCVTTALSTWNKGSA